MSVIARRLLLAVSENRIGGIVGAMEREGNEKSRAPMKVRGYRLQAVPVSLFPTRQSHGERISIYRVLLSLLFATKSYAYVIACLTITF